MAEHFYAEVRYQSKSAVVLITSDNQWKLRWEETGMNFEKYAGKGGTWSLPMTSLTQYYFYKPGTKDEVFRMSGIQFPPRIVMEPKFLDNQFHIGPEWARALGYSTTHDATMANLGRWYAVATGPLMSWIKQYCEEKTAELKKLAIALGINVAAIFDPTGTLSLVGAIEASTRGDYLGCALNLVAAIPILGKAAQAARNTRIATRIEELLNEIKVLNDWLKASKTVLTRSQVAVTKGLEGVVGVVKAGVQLLKNEGWIMKMDPKDMTAVGFLPKECEILAQLAQKGYYIVIRACNPERVEWLMWAAKAGVRMLAKPLWIKTKSLKRGNLRGLVGWSSDDVATKLLIPVKPPAGFQPGWLAKGGHKAIGYYKVPGAHANTFGLTNATNASEHIVVQVGDQFILCDAKGAAYISDLDVVLIQRQLSTGNFGPPGMNVGPPGTVYKGGSYGGDNAEVGKMWNDIFEAVGYPPGYKAFQHGELTGTAGNLKMPKPGTFDPATQVRSPVWHPEDTWDTEKLIVAAPNIQIGGTTTHVGLATDWTKLKNFHEANGGGVFRFDPPAK